jgi:hypothetical protein
VKKFAAWFREYHVTVALAITAVLCAWGLDARDKHVRLQRLQLAQVACLWHRKPEHCVHLRPNPPAAGLMEYCLMRFDPQPCKDFVKKVTP